MDRSVVDDLTGTGDYDDGFWGRSCVRLVTEKAALKKAIAELEQRASFYEKESNAHAAMRIQDGERIADLEHQLAEKEAALKVANDRIAELEEKWQKNSRLRVMWREECDRVHRKYDAAIEEKEGK